MLTKGFWVVSVKFAQNIRYQTIFLQRKLTNLTLKQKLGTFFVQSKRLRNFLLKDIKISAGCNISIILTFISFF